MLDKIKTILTEHTKGFTKDEKLAYIQTLGFNNWDGIVNATDQDLHKLHVTLLGDTTETKSVKLSGALYTVSQPKGNKSVKRITWGNREILRYLERK